MMFVDLRGIGCEGDILLRLLLLEDSERVGLLPRSVFVVPYTFWRDSSSELGTMSGSEEDGRDSIELSLVPGPAEPVFCFNYFRIFLSYSCCCKCFLLSAPLPM